MPLLEDVSGQWVTLRETADTTRGHDEEVRYGLPSHVDQSIQVTGTGRVPSRHLLLQVVERDYVDQGVHLDQRPLTDSRRWESNLEVKQRGKVSSGICGADVALVCTETGEAAKLESWKVRLSNESQVGLEPPCPTLHF